MLLTDSVLEQDRLVRGEAAKITTRRLLPRLHRRRQLRRGLRVPPEPFRLAQSERSDETDLCTLHMCNRYEPDQMYVTRLPVLFSFADHLPIKTVVLSAIQDILLQLHLRECGLL